MHVSYIRLLFLSGLCLYLQFSFAQPPRDRYLEIKYDNDFLNYRLAGTDHYYSSGFFANLVKPRRRSSTLFKHLFFSDETDVKAISEIGLSQLVYTPDDLGTVRVDEGDYPYIGLLTAYYSTVFNSSANGLRVSSRLEAGTMGKYSLAEQAQELFHHILSYAPPAGWNSEVSKPFMANYDLQVEKGILFSNKWVAFIPNAGIRLGMINTSLSAGAIIQLFSASDYFTFFHAYAFGQKPSQKLKVYLTWQPQFTYVAWNGLLEPALKKDLEPYKAEYGQGKTPPTIKRSLLDNVVSVYFHFGNTRIGLTQSFYARQLSTTSNQAVGGVSIMFRF